MPRDISRAPTTQALFSEDSKRVLKEMSRLAKDKTTTAGDIIRQTLSDIQAKNWSDLTRTRLLDDYKSIGITNLGDVDKFKNVAAPWVMYAAILKILPKLSCDPNDRASVNELIESYMDLAKESDNGATDLSAMCPFTIIFAEIACRQISAAKLNALFRDGSIWSRISPGEVYHLKLSHEGKIYVSGPKVYWISYEKAAEYTSEHKTPRRYVHIAPISTGPGRRDVLHPGARVSEPFTPRWSVVGHGVQEMIIYFEDFASAEAYREKILATVSPEEAELFHIKYSRANENGYLRVSTVYGEVLVQASRLHECKEADLSKDILAETLSDETSAEKSDRAKFVEYVDEDLYSACS